MKNFIRDILVMIAVVLTLPAWLPVRLARLVRSSDDIFATCAEIMSMFPGAVGVYLRRGFYWVCLERCARDCSIGFGTWLSHPEVCIGKHVYIGGRCTIGKAEIGDDVLIGSNVDILSGRHQHHDGEDGGPRWKQGGTFSKVRIGANAWIGNSAVIMADVGAGSIVGAGSVVVKPVPPQTVACGNPAVVKKSVGAGPADGKKPGQME